MASSTELGALGFFGFLAREVEASELPVAARARFFVFILNGIAGRFGLKFCFVLRRDVLAWGS
jgi:hypothetical protein